MSDVAIERVDGAAILDELKAVAEQIRQRASELFEGRGGVGGMAIEDWMKAERELLHFPEFQLAEQAGRFEINVQVSAFKPGGLKVTVMPDALIVKALPAYRNAGHAGIARLRGFGRKMLFRRFELPEPIDVDQVTANLDEGVLHLTALKASRETPPKQLAPAA